MSNIVTRNSISEEEKLSYSKYHPSYLCVESKNISNQERIPTLDPATTNDMKPPIFLSSEVGKLSDSQYYHPLYLCVKTEQDPAQPALMTHQS